MAIVGDFYGQSRRGLALGIVGALTEAGAPSVHFMAL